LQWLERHNPAIVDEVYAADCVIYGNHMDRRIRFGREGFKEYGKGLYTAFPDLRISHDLMVTDENGPYQMIYWTFEGTHLGPMGFVPPTGKKVSISGIDVFRIADGKIRELYLAQDAFALMQQLGVIPSQG
jgi:steroid delta-isomerase-like uncharacterized protein